jgi:hypothetical protein
MQRNYNNFVLLIWCCPNYNPNYNVQIANFEHYLEQKMCKSKRGDVIQIFENTLL